MPSFFFNDTATTEIYTLSLHDALPIFEEKGGAWYGGSTVILGIGQGELQVTPLQNARWTAAVATGNMVTARLGLAIGTDAATYTALPAPGATPLPFAAELGPEIGRAHV